jgi:hypothetical protein
MLQEAGCTWVTTDPSFLCSGGPILSCALVAGKTPETESREAMSARTITGVERRFGLNALDMTFSFDKICSKPRCGLAPSSVCDFSQEKRHDAAEEFFKVVDSSRGEDQ